MRYLLIVLLTTWPALAQELPHDHPQGEPEVVATFHGAMPTGVTVSADNRIFLCFPRWGDEVPHTVAELVDGRTVPYPPSGADSLLSVQSVVVDPANRLWLLDKVIDLGDKGGASDGLESDSTGAVYLTNYEHNAILRREADGTFTTLVQDPRVLWPDTLSLARDGYLYFTANQLHRQPQFHKGRDLRVRPYLLLRLRVDRQPVLLLR